MITDMVLTKSLNPWQLDAWDSIPPLLHGKTIGLVHLDDLPNLPIDTVLISITGHTGTVGSEDSKIDTNVRGGYLAYGLPVGWGWSDDPKFIVSYCRIWHEHYDNSRQNKRAGVQPQTEAS